MMTKKGFEDEQNLQKLTKYIGSMGVCLLLAHELGNQTELARN
jgi:hypothetical protein